MEAAIKDKKEELEEVVRRAECLGKEVAPGEGEAEKVILSVSIPCVGTHLFQNYFVLVHF